MVLAVVISLDTSPAEVVAVTCIKYLLSSSTGLIVKNDETSVVVMVVLPSS